jgi:SAM-dependent methyltransferase
MQLKDTFDTVADLYDAVRPSYPTALFEAVAAAAAIEPGDWALEVGCGSGQATSGLLAVGLTVTALDPGPALIAAARRRYAGIEAVDFVTAPFEAWTPPARAFRVVASAQAWHWIDPAIAFAKAADALEPGGVLAVFGNVPVPIAPELLERVAPIYADRGLDVRTPPPESWYLPHGPIADLFAASGRFEPATHQAFPWTWRKTLAEHLDFLRSRSDHQMLPAGDLESLLADLAVALADQPPELAIEYESHLYWARRREGCAAPQPELSS